jgi:hypothetical protein
MGKSDYKKLSNNKENYVQNRLGLKNIYCTSKDYIKWAKNYLNRSDRRKYKQNLKENLNENNIS